METSNSGRFKKGQTAWNKGKRMPDSMRKKMREVAKGRIGEKSPRWQKKPTYNAVHLWIRKCYGRAEKCEKCAKTRTTPRTMHWANKSGKYLRDRSDWMQLCPRCHVIYDQRWTMRKRNPSGQFK